MKIWVDDELVFNSNALSATFGIGKYNGGGMMQFQIIHYGLLALILQHRDLLLQKFEKVAKISPNIDFVS